jgi:hypothetical protein
MCGERNFFSWHERVAIRVLKCIFGRACGRKAAIFGRSCGRKAAQGNEGNLLCGFTVRSGGNRIRVHGCNTRDLLRGPLGGGWNDQLWAASFQLDGPSCDNVGFGGFQIFPHLFPTKPMADDQGF